MDHLDPADVAALGHAECAGCGRIGDHATGCPLGRERDTCETCGRPTHEGGPVDDALDCGGDCWGCIRVIEAHMAEDTEASDDAAWRARLTELGAG